MTAKFNNQVLHLNFQTLMPQWMFCDEIYINIPTNYQEKKRGGGGGHTETPINSKIYVTHTPQKVIQSI